MSSIVDMQLQDSCRFCLESIEVKKGITIDRILEDKFEEFTQLKLINSEKYSKNICLQCSKMLEKSLKFRKKLIEKQKELYGIYGSLLGEVKEEIGDFESVDVKLEDPIQGLDDKESYQELESGSEFPECDVFIQQSKRSSQTSLETRKKIIEEFVAGKTAREISILLDIKRTTCHEIIKRFKNTGQVEVQRKVGNRAKIKQKEKEAIRQWISEDPDITTKIIMEKCNQEFGIVVGKTTIGRLMKDLGCVLKRDYVYAEPNYEESRERRVSKDQETVLCPDCGGFFKKCSLELHILRKHVKEKRFGCDICGYRNFTKRHLRLHMQTHLSQRKFKCPECNSRFMMPSIVRNHIKSVHRKNETLPRFQCQFKDCLKWFRLNHVLTEHVKRVHLKRAEFVCDFPSCGESFIYKEAYKAHLERHGEPTIPCAINSCNKLFFTEQKMKQHKIRHDKKINCKLCLKSFVNEKEFEFHKLTVHEGVRNHVCRFCNNKYFRKNHLSRHILEQHLNFKIDCEVSGCSSQFARKSNYKKHILAAHQNLEPQRIQTILMRIRNMKVEVDPSLTNDGN